MDVLINQWRNRFYTALQNKDWDTFKREMLVFSAIAAGSPFIPMRRVSSRNRSSGSTGDCATIPRPTA